MINIFNIYIMELKKDIVLLSIITCIYPLLVNKLINEFTKGSTKKKELYYTILIYIISILVSLLIDNPIYKISIYTGIITSSVWYIYNNNQLLTNNHKLLLLSNLVVVVSLLVMNIYNSNNVSGELNIHDMILLNYIKSDK